MNDAEDYVFYHGTGVTAVDAEDHVFYHGTGATAADAILEVGAQDTFLEELGAAELGREIWRAVQDCCSNDTDFGPDSESSLWIPALRELANPGEAWLGPISAGVRYGEFYATVNIATAYRCPASGPMGLIEAFA